MYNKNRNKNYVYNKNKNKNKRIFVKKVISYSTIVLDYKSKQFDQGDILRLFFKQFNCSGNRQRSYNFFFKFLSMLKIKFLKHVVLYYQNLIFRKVRRYLKVYKAFQNMFESKSKAMVMVTIVPKFELFLNRLTCYYVNYIREYNFLIQKFFENLQKRVFNFNAKVEQQQFMFLFPKKVVSKVLIKQERKKKKILNNMDLFNEVVISLQWADMLTEEEVDRVAEICFGDVTNVNKEVVECEAKNLLIGGTTLKFFSKKNVSVTKNRSSQVFLTMWKTFKRLNWAMDPDLVLNVKSLNFFKYIKLRGLNFGFLFILYLIKRDKTMVIRLPFVRRFNTFFFSFLKFLSAVQLKKQKNQSSIFLLSNLFFKHYFLKKRNWTVFTVFKSIMWYHRPLVIVRQIKKGGLFVTVPFPVLRIRNQIGFFFKTFFDLFGFNFPKYKLKNGLYKLKSLDFIKCVVLEFFYLTIFENTKSLYCFQYKKKLRVDLKENRSNLRLLKSYY